MKSLQIPVYQRGGTIIPKKERIRRASTLMKNDPYTLVVALDRLGKAKGTLYIDDEISYEYRNGKFIYVEYEFSDYKLVNRFIGKPNYKTESWMERIIIVGLDRVPKSATITVDGTATQLEILRSPLPSVVIRKPGVNMGLGFTIALNF